MRVGILCSALFLLFASAAAAQWDAAKWSRQAAIEIDYSAGSRDLDRYQVRVALDEKSLDFKAARPDGADLRLVDRDGRTLLPYWIERFDPADRQAVVWVCVPALAAGQKRVVHLHYGNPAAAPASAAIPVLPSGLGVTAILRAGQWATAYASAVASASPAAFPPNRRLNSAPAAAPAGIGSQNETRR